MPTSIENYIFNELPRRLVLDSSIATGSSLTASWVLVATGVGTQAIPVDPATLGFEPVVTPGNASQYYRGDKTWADLDAAAVGAIAATEKGQALGVATLDAEGYVQLSQMNPAVIERVVVVADEAARYALTTDEVQNGDVVNQQLDGNNDPVPSMWYVVDQTNLDNASGYLPFSSGVAASVAWSDITGKPAIVGDLENISLASEGDLIQYIGGTWVNVDIPTLKSNLALEISDINSLQDDLDGKQSQSDVLDNLSNISTTGLIVRNSDGLFIGRELVGTNGITVTEPKGDADNPTLSLTETGVTAGTYGDEFNYPVVEIDEFGRNISVTTQTITRNPIHIQDVSSTTLQANTEHIFGNGIATYTSNMSLDLPDNVPGGTWVKIKCGEDFEQVQGSVAIVAPVGKTVQGDPSFPFSSYFKLYPFSTLDLVYSSSTSNWTVFSNAASFSSHLYVARQGATDGPSNSHLIRSNATSLRVLDIPDRDVDLSSVGQTDFADNVFTVSDDDDSTKKIAFQASGIATGQTKTITMPNADVDLGKVPTNLAYSSATAVLTQTLTDGTSLSADLSETAISRIVLTGSATVVVSATQPSTKYFLAGSSVTTFDVGAFTNTGRFIEIVNNSGYYVTITLTATGKSFKDEVNDNVAMPITLVRGESVFVFPVSASALQVYRNKPDIRNIKNNANTVTSGFKVTNLFVDSSFSVTGNISAQADEILRIFALANSTINFGNSVYDARTNTQISTGSYTLYAGQVLEVTKTSATKWVVLGGHIQDTSRFRLYNSSNVPTKFDTSAATAERTITMPDADVNIGALKSLNTLPVGVTNLTQLRAGHDYFVTQSGIILGIQTTSALGLYDTSIGYSFSNTTSSDLTVTVRWTAGTGTPGLVSHVDAISGSTIAAAFLTLTPTYDYVYTLPKGGTLRLLPNAASNVTILRSFNVNLGLVGQTDFLDGVFRISNSTSSNKRIAFSASGIDIGKTRTIFMGDSDVNLGSMMNAVTVLGSTHVVPDTGSSNTISQRYHYIAYGGFSLNADYARGAVWITNVTNASITVSLTGLPSYRDDAGTSITSCTMYAGESISLTQDGTVTTVRRYGSVNSNTFRVYDGTTPSKRVSFNVSGIADNSTKVITMPNANVDLGNVAQAASNYTTGYLTSADWNTFNNKLGLADVRYVFLNDSTTTQTTYTVPASAVTATGRTIIELSNNSLTSITINTATGTGKVAGDSVNISITGTYAAQALVASGVAFQGDLAFSYQHQTKTLVYKGSNVWKIVG